MEGEIVLMPGFCFNRVTDFACYMWILPKPPPPGWKAPQPPPTGAGDPGQSVGDPWGDFMGEEYNGFGGGVQTTGELNRC